MNQTLLRPEEITISNYEEAVSRFCSVLPQKEHDAHMALGLADEYFELSDAINNNDNVNVKEEAGDMLWYISQFCRKNNISFATVVDDLFIEFHSSEIAITEARISELIYYCKAKIAGYTKSFSEKQVNQFVKESTAYVFSEIGKVFGYEVFNDTLLLVEILQKNYAKLANRHGETFNADNGQTRDTAAEREILEK